MNAEKKEKWIEALRSGKYEQGTSALKYRSGGGTCKYCCLGVLQDINGRMNEPAGHDIYFKSDTGSLTALVGDDFEFYGFDDLKERQKVQTLMQMNDSHQSFNVIAAYIKRYL